MKSTEKLNFLKLLRNLFDYLKIYKDSEAFYSSTVLIEIEELYLYISNAKFKVGGDFVISSEIDRRLNSIHKKLYLIKIFDIEFRMVLHFFDKEIYEVYHQ